MARIVQQVVEPVLAVMPIPMDTGAAPVTTMGPGQLATDEVMPAIFAEPDGQEELEEPEEDEAARVERATRFHGLFRHDIEPMDEGDFDDEKEH